MTLKKCDNPKNIDDSLLSLTWRDCIRRVIWKEKKRQSQDNNQNGNATNTV